MKRSQLRQFVWQPLLWCLLATVSCAGAGTPPRLPSSSFVASDAEALVVDTKNFGGADQVTVHTKLAGSAFDYFRFINDAFAELLCKRYVDELSSEVIVNLHGDAHIEQYAVADDGRGLVDFDASTPGKPLIDWLRFATSLWLVAEERKLGDATQAVKAFFRGYRAALADPNYVAPEPRLIQKVRSNFMATSDWMTHVEGFVEALPPETEEDLRRATADYRAAMLRQNPGLNESFFRTKRVGSLRMGIGSAHQAKFLARVEGWTDAADDDLFLEAKQVPGRRSHCAGTQVSAPGAARIVEGQRRLSNGPQRFLGVFQYEGSYFYVQAWRVNYTELATADFESKGDLEEIAFDVGTQLGRGHPKEIGNPQATQLPLMLRHMSMRLESTVIVEGRQLSSLTQRAWRLAMRVR